MNLNDEDSNLIVVDQDLVIYKNKYRDKIDRQDLYCWVGVNCEHFMDIKK